jgi:hypothetical protein
MKKAEESRLEPHAEREDYFESTGICVSILHRLRLTTDGSQLTTDD